MRNEQMPKDKDANAVDHTLTQDLKDQLECPFMLIFILNFGQLVCAFPFAQISPPLLWLFEERRKGKSRGLFKRISFRFFRRLGFTRGWIWFWFPDRSGQSERFGFWIGFRFDGGAVEAAERGADHGGRRRLGECDWIIVSGISGYCNIMAREWTSMTSNEWSGERLHKYSTVLRNVLVGLRYAGCVFDLRFLQPRPSSTTVINMQISDPGTEDPKRFRSKW